MILLVELSRTGTLTESAPVNETKCMNLLLIYKNVVYTG